jgi:hypothetical protein
MTERIYAVNNTTGDKTRLVLAANPAQALRHVARDQFDVKVASSLDVARLMAGGVTVEQIKADPHTIDLVDEAMA